jgi:AP-4 complex subunit beta-1
MASIEQPKAFSELRKGEVNELRRHLGNVSVRRNKKQLKEVIKKVIAYMTLGINVSRLFSEMVMACQSAEIVIKKMVYLFLTHYSSSNADLAILAINTLRKDCGDPDPMVRGLALRSLTNLHISSILEYVIDPLSLGLEDQSAYVRRTAVLGVLKVYHLDSGCIVDNDYINVLYNMLRDGDCKVIINSIVVLNEIMVNEGGIAINTSIIVHLLKRINDFDIWGKCTVLNLVSKYRPNSDTEMYGLLNVFETMLSISNSGVVLELAKCFIITSSRLDRAVQKQIFSRLKDPLLTLISGYARIETAFVVLKHVALIVRRESGIFNEAYKQFYCRFNDPSNIQYAKVYILPYLADKSNVHEICAELSEYVAGVDMKLAVIALEAFGIVVYFLPSTLQGVVDQLLEFLEIDKDYVRSGAAVVLRDILRAYPELATTVGHALISSLRRAHMSHGSAAIVWLLGEFGDLIQNAPYVLEEIIKKDRYKQTKSGMGIEILHAVTKMFFYRPAETRQLLGTLLASILKSNDVDPDLFDRAIFIYRLLQENAGNGMKTMRFRNIVSPRSPKSLLNSGLVRTNKMEIFNTLQVLFDVSGANMLSMKHHLN